MSATVRINPESHRKLKTLAKELGASMPSVLEQAIEALRRQRFLDQASTAYGEFRKDKKAWSEEQAERKAWDKTLNDGLTKE
jgi:predicted transcriptional regulator